MYEKKTQPPISMKKGESVNSHLSTDNAELMERLVNLVFYRIDNNLDLPS